jgi:hypothetical protein
MTGGVVEAERLAEEASAVAKRLGDEGLMREAVSTQLSVALARRDTAGAERSLEVLGSFLRNRASWQDLQALWQFRGEVDWLAGRRALAREAFGTARGLGVDRGLSNGPALLSLASMALEDGDSAAAGLVLGESTALSTGGTPYSHEHRTCRSILRIEQAIRSGDLSAGLGALQDAEILMRQFLIADIRGLESLERSAALAGVDQAIVLRLENLGRAISDALAPEASGP